MRGACGGRRKSRGWGGGKRAGEEAKGTKADKTLRQGWAGGRKAQEQTARGSRRSSVDKPTQRVRRNGTTRAVRTLRRRGVVAGHLAGTLRLPPSFPPSNHSLPSLHSVFTISQSTTNDFCFPPSCIPSHSNPYYSLSFIFLFPHFSFTVFCISTSFSPTLLTMFLL